MTLTEEQRRAVEAPGSAAVVAGAGTGKTHMLVARYLHHLSEDGLSPLQVVAVTFTEKAAEELRSRIRRQARESLPGSEGVLAELEAAQIGTIHALCARICREHPEEAEVPPDFGILDELRGVLWTADRVADLMDQLPAKHYDNVPYPLMQLALESFFTDPLAVEAALDRGPEEWEELAVRARTDALANFLQNPDLRRCINILTAYSGAADDRTEEARAAALAALSGLEGSNVLEQVKIQLATLDRIDLRGGSKKNWGEGELSLVKEALKEVRELARAEIKRGMILLQLGPADELLARMLPVLRDAFRQARESVSRAKRRARLLDFSDLEIHALKALEGEGVRSYYRERWHAFLVDEFQDTNPVQAALLERLTEEATLTVVGDEKQSIYGFRRADVEVFRRFRGQILTEGGAEVVLATSFRAHVGVTSTINAVFSPVLGDLRQDLTAHRQHPPHEAPHVRAYTIEAEGKVRKTLLRRAEATLIAELIREMLETATPVHDSSAGVTRPARPGDFALLSRAWEPLDAYGEALSAAGIPSVHAGGGDLLHTREAKDGLALLRFLVDPEEDDLALVAVLRGPFFALDDRLLTELAEHREEGNSWWRLLRDASSDHPRLAEAVGVLEQLLDARRLEPPANLLALADHLTGYTAVIANLPGAERREADWRGFRELVRELAHGSEDTFAVMRWLRRLLDADAEVPRPPLVAGEDAATLTSVHGSKGLEWPVVVLPDLDRRVPLRSDPVLYDPGLGVSVDLGDDEEEPVLHRLISDRKAILEEAELRRLFYVALTRAGDHLILTTTDVGTNRLCGLTLLRPGLDLAGINFVSVPFRPQDAHPPELPSPQPKAHPRLLVEPIG